MDKLYRVTSNGKGIYRVIKESISQNEWHDFLNSKISTWLPNPGKELYEFYECISFFTEEGYKKFLHNIMPIISLSIPIEVTVISDTDNGLLYSDKYQKVFNKEWMK